MDEMQKKRLRRALWVMCIPVAAVGAYALFYNIVGFGIPCMTYEITGYQCSGCGLTRAAGSLVRLDFADAFRHNAMWPVYIGYGIWAVLSMALPYIKRGDQIDLPRPLWVNFVCLGLILSYGVVRNFF